MGVYFEESWAILSTIGVANVLYGLIVISITRFSIVVAVPIVVSIATAVANGLCYYAFYEDYPRLQQAIASAFADFLWMVQEVGLSFYGYSILNRVLTNRRRHVFMALFWIIVFAIVVLRVLILSQRVQAILNSDSNLQTLINRLHVGYFALIAILECTSAYFLLRRFATVKKASAAASLWTGLLSHFMRGTEIRVASLALIGVSRAVTYFFQPSLQAASSIASQLDRFFYTLECLFPIMFYIDILASRIKFAGQAQQASHRMNHVDAPGQKRRSSKSFSARPEHNLYPEWEEIEDEPFPEGLRSISRAAPGDARSLSMPETAKLGAAKIGITKTWEVNVHNS